MLEKHADLMLYISIVLNSDNHSLPCILVLVIEAFMWFLLLPSLDKSVLLYFVCAKIFISLTVFAEVLACACCLKSNVGFVNPGLLQLRSQW